MVLKDCTGDGVLLTGLFCFRCYSMFWTLRTPWCVYCHCCTEQISQWLTVGQWATHTLFDFQNCFIDVSSYWFYCFQKIFSRMPVLTEVVRLLSDPRLGKENTELVQSLCWRLLPFLVITSPQLRLASCVARSSIITQHPLTMNWAEGDKLKHFTAENSCSQNIWKHFNDACRWMW